MARVPGSRTRTRTRTDAMDQVGSAESYHAVLDSCPPGYVEKISRYFESSVGPSKQDEGPVCNEPAEAESDSGDSLFLTQKCVPEAVRSRRQRHYSLRSTPISPRDLEEPSRSEDSPSSSSHEESRTDKGRRRKKYTLPKYHFPFLAKCMLRSTLLPVQNASLHHYVMGGFFNCVRDLWQGYQRPHLEPCLPTVDVDGQDLSPLSEEDEERPEDEDIKVVERKHFVAPSKAKSKQTWCKPLKQQRRRGASDTRPEITRGRRTAVIPTSSGTETPDRGESSCRVRGQRERNDEHRNVTIRNKTPKRRRNRESQTGEEELCNYNDAVCEPQKPQRRDSTPKNAVREPQTDGSHVEDLFQAGQDGDGSERPSPLHSLSDVLRDTHNDSICNETQVKKRKKKKRGHLESGDGGQSQSQEEPGGLHAATSVNMDVEETPSLSEDNGAETPAARASEQREFNERNGTEKESRDDKVLSREERDTPDSKHNRKKRKKNKSSADEVDGNLESGVRAEDSVFPVSCNMEDGSKEKKKKKKKKRRSGEDVEHSESGAVAEPLKDEAEKPKRKKKKRKKEEGLVDPEQREEEEEASTRTLDSPPLSTEQIEESGNRLEHAAASLETPESSSVKRKKHKKKRQSSSNDAARDEEEGADVSFCMDDSVTLAKGSGTSLKKKKKKAAFDVSYTPEENQKTVNNNQKPEEGIEDQNAEMLIKEKKKKKKKICKILSRKISEDTVVQIDDSVSVREKDGKKASAFLVADTEENEAQNPHVWGAEKPVVSAGDSEQLLDGSTKKKRKRKMSVEQHSGDCEYPTETCPGALFELADTGLTGKRKQRVGNESRSETPTERFESTADVDKGAVVWKKKKKRKKKCEDEPSHVIHEGPPSGTEDAESVGSTLNTCPSVSHKKTGKHGRSAEGTLDLVERASASPETLALNDRTDEKKKKKKMKSTDSVLLEGRSSTRSAESEPQQNKKKERIKQSPVPTIIFSSPIISETSLSTSQVSLDNLGKTKQRKVKRRLLNPNEDFLADC
ncbi:phoenix [Etheostoma cragini]|uniref:phoenix n=1 Tax=Etheostoma cragini TaxID=417921 RepID=UPI00155ED111|nr:phoenix [Etheostoma cragini]XP_034746395.1 phoenix [Etheostoma cragini]